MANQMPEPAKIRLRPHATLACILTSLVVSICWLMYHQGVDEFEPVLLLVPPPIRIFQDNAYWALITATFVHLDWIHLLFNLLVMWRLSPFLETILGSFRWFALFLVAAVVTGAFQLMFGGWGMGLSGVLYAIFGFMWQTRKLFPLFKKILPRQLIQLLLLWLVLCQVFTLLNVIHVANTAHVTGLVFGCALAWTISPPEEKNRRILPWLLIVGMIAIAVLSLSFDWRLHKISERRAGQAKALGNETAHRMWTVLHELCGRDYGEPSREAMRRFLENAEYDAADKLVERSMKLDPELGRELIEMLRRARPKESEANSENPSRAPQK